MKYVPKGKHAGCEVDGELGSRRHISSLLSLCDCVVCSTVRSRKPQAFDKHRLHSDQDWDAFLFSFFFFLFQDVMR